MMFLDGLLEESGIAVDLGGQAHVDVAIADRDHEATDDRRVDDGAQLEGLALLQKTGEGSLNFLQSGSIQRLTKTFHH